MCLQCWFHMVRRRTPAQGGWEDVCLRWCMVIYNNFLFLFSWYWGGRHLYVFRLIPYFPFTPRFVFSKKTTFAAGGCSQYFCFFFAIPFFFASKKKVLVYILLSYTIFLYSLYISANRCTSNLLKMTHLLLISANSQNPPSPALSNLFSKHHLLLKW